MAAVLALGAAMAAAPASPAMAAATWPGPSPVHLMPTLNAAAQLPAGQGGSNGLLYMGGGPVQHQPTIFLDFWGSAWTDGTADAGGYTGAAAQNYVQTFVRAIGTGTWFASQTQYCDGIPRAGGCDAATAQHVGMPALGSVWNDTATTPAANQDGVAAEADRAAAHFRLEQVVDATVIVLTPTGQSFFADPDGRAFCGYHAATAHAVFAYVPWEPDAGARCGQNAVNKTDDAFGHGHLDGLSLALGHEVAAIATDPFLGQGWTDQLLQETGDKCEGRPTLPTAAVTFGTSATFAVQPLWTDSGDSCATADLGGGTSGAPSAASWGPTHRDVFIRGLDNALWWRRWDGGAWSGWASLGGGLASDPAAVSWGVGRTDVFAEGMDGALWHIAWAAGTGWSGWQSLGGQILWGHVAAASWASGGLDVAAVGTDHAMWHRRWNNGWSAWERLGGIFSNGPAAVSWRDGTDRVDIVGPGQDSEMWQITWNGSSWSDWTPRGGLLLSPPTITSTGPGRLQAYGVGTDSAIWRATFDGGAWSAWSPVDAGLWANAPAAVSPPATGSVEIYVVGVGGSTLQLTVAP